MQARTHITRTHYPRLWYGNFSLCCIGGGLACRTKVPFLSVHAIPQPTGCTCNVAATILCTVPRGTRESGLELVHPRSVDTARLTASSPENALLLLVVVHLAPIHCTICSSSHACQRAQTWHNALAERMRVPTPRYHRHMVLRMLRHCKQPPRDADASINKLLWNEIQ